MMKSDIIKNMQEIARRHAFVKKNVISMCDDMDREIDIKKKEVIKTAIETSRKELDSLEKEFQICMDKIEN